MRLILYATILFLVFSGELHADSFVLPNNAKSIKEINSAAEAVKGFGDIHSAHFTVLFGRQVYAIWYNPYSGLNNTHLSIYYWSYKNRDWTKMVEERLFGTHDISVEIPVNGKTRELVVRNANGDVVFTEEILSLPHKENE